MQKLLRKGLCLVVIYGLLISATLLLADRVEKLEKSGNTNNVSLKVFR